MAAGRTKASFWNCCGVRTRQSHWPGCRRGDVLHLVSVAEPARGRGGGGKVRPTVTGPAVATAKVCAAEAVKVPRSFLAGRPTGGAAAGRPSSGGFTCRTRWRAARITSSLGGAPVLALRNRAESRCQSESGCLSGIASSASSSSAKLDRCRLRLRPLGPSPRGSALPRLGRAARGCSWSMRCVRRSTASLSSSRPDRSSRIRAVRLEPPAPPTSGSKVAAGSCCRRPAPRRLLRRHRRLLRCQGKAGYRLHPTLRAGQARQPMF